VPGVAKVEWHPGELIPRVGFIVTNMSRPAERVDALQQANAVRLQLHETRPDTSKNSVISRSTTVPAAQADAAVSAARLPCQVAGKAPEIYSRSRVIRAMPVKATGRGRNYHVPTLLRRDLAICYRIVSGQPCTGSRLSRHNHTGRRLRDLSSRRTVRGCHPPITTTFVGWTNPCK
jgi:hypothetical protein